MKTGLVSAIVVAVLLISSLLYWKTRPLQGAAPELHSQAGGGAPESPVELSDGTAGSEDTPRSEAAPAAIASPALDGDLASAQVPGETVPAVTAPMQETREAGNEVFEGRYAGMSTDARRAAREALRVLVEGGSDKAPVLTERQSREVKLEIEWLTEHESP